MLRIAPSHRIFGRVYLGSRYFASAAVSNDATVAETTVRKRLDVAIVGAPNAGKSQLLNALTKSPVAAVSRKRHTTRTDILGARTVGNTQIVFKDTPGFLRIEDAKEERLNRDLLVNAASEMQHVDYTLLVVDAARNMSDHYRHALVQLMLYALQAEGRMEEDYNDDEDDNNNNSNKQSSGLVQESTLPRNQPKFAVVLNKVDLVKPKSKLLELAMEIGAMADACLVDIRRQTLCNTSENGEAEEGGQEKQDLELDFETLMNSSPVSFYVSALEEDGTEDILEHLLDLATPCRVWAIPPGKSTDMSSEQHIEELIREKIYRCLHQEVPHSVKQVNRLFKRVPQGVVIHQDLVVFNKSHHKLVLGSGGRTLQRIQDSAMRDLKKLFGCDVMLQLHVKLNKSKQRRNPDEHVSQTSSQSFL